VAGAITQVERLDGDAATAQVMSGAGGIGDRAEPAEQRLERTRPVLLGAEQQPDDVFDLGHSPSQG
jgi:hypothetical protein